MKFIVLFVLVVGVLFTVQAQEKEIETGRKAPNFKLENIDGKYVELSKEIGSGPILISFWATWCKPCVEELIEYKKIYDEYNFRGLKIFAISVDNEKTVSKVMAQAKARRYPFTILLDTNSDTARKYYAQAVPYTVIIDINGNIAYTHLGYMKGDELKIRSKLDELFSKIKYKLVD